MQVGGGDVADGGGQVVAAFAPVLAPGRRLRWVLWLAALVSSGGARQMLGRAPGSGGRW